MPTPGPEVLRRILEGEAQAKKIESDARQAAEEASRQVDELVAGQTEALRELAQYYLPRLDQDGGAKTSWNELQGTLNDVLLRKDDALKKATSRLHAAQAVRGAAESKWQAACDRVNTLTRQCDDLANQLADRLAQDTELQTLARRAAEGQARLEQAEQSLDDVERDAKVKLPAYEQSSLFQYLNQRGFGTPTYTHRGLTRRLDRWVARLIDYPKASASYRFLKNTPEPMRQLIIEQRATIQSTVAEVESRQASMANSLGLPRAQAEGAQARAEQDELALIADKAREEENQAREQVAQLQSDHCPFYLEALSAFQKLLDGMERSVIAARAAQTPELTDDQVVARLKRIDADLTERRRLLGERSKSAQLASQRAAQYGQLAAKFRRAQFDHPRSVFDDEFDINGQLWAILDGTTDADRVWQLMRRYQRLGPTMADKTAAALQHPMSQILVQTMAQAAGAALGSYAARASQQTRTRRNDHRDWF